MTRTLGTTPLRIHCRKTYQDDGDPIVEEGVHCPRRDADVTVGECVGCAGCLGVRVSPRGRWGFIICGAPTGQLHVGSSEEDDRAANLPTVESIMTTPVVCVRLELSVVALESLLQNFGIQSAPVVDEAGRVKGMVSETDLLRYHQQRRLPETTRDQETVADIMIPRTLSIPDGASIPRAAALLAFEGVERAPVVNAGGEVVGLASALDIARWVATENGFIVGAGAHDN